MIGMNEVVFKHRCRPMRISLCVPSCFLGLFVCVQSALCADQPQWGQAWSRNQVSAETGLPASFDPAAGTNLKWKADLGTETYSTPIIAYGKVFIGTNNIRPRDPHHTGDRGITLCLKESDGSLCWQLVSEKIGATDVYLDWPRAGNSCPVTVEGDRVYTVTSSNKVVCLDINGMANGNDGPFKDEARLATPADKDPDPLCDLDADILWAFDIPSKAGTYPHDAAHASILIDGPFLYLNTSNGVDNTHRKIRKPDGPSLIVLDKATGRLLARDNEGIGPRIFHSTWSSPGIGVIGDRRFVYFAGGDGVVYSFEMLKAIPPEGTVETLKRIWKFDPDPAGPKENVSQYLTNRETSPSNIKGMAVFDAGRIYVAVGGDIWWGKNQAWLKCFKADGTGDITSSALVWSYDLNRHSCSTPAIVEGLVFAADAQGTLHCVDAATGKAVWTHDLGAEIWASPMVADGKVYLGTRRGELWVFAAAREKKQLAAIDLDAPISATVIAANKTLFIATNKTLYAAGIGK